MSWSYALATNAGDGKAECQDACAVRPCGDLLIAALSDGAGSATHARQGARLVVDTFLELGAELAASREAQAPILREIRARVEAAASESQASPSDFSATLVGAVITPRQAIFLQVGDGAAVVSDENGVAVAQPPDVCEFVNTTRFATSAESEKFARLVVLDRAIERCALFSDGLQPLLIDSQGQPHAPFFSAAFKTLRAAEKHDAAASDWIARTLASEPVLRRTDDDTSLILARRLPS